MVPAAAGERGRRERAWGEPAGGGRPQEMEKEREERAAAGAGERGEGEQRREVLTSGPIATWGPHQQNHPPKQPNGQI
jgi:hypothetical protein